MKDNRRSERIPWWILLEAVADTELACKICRSFTERFGSSNSHGATHFCLLKLLCSNCRKARREQAEADVIEAKRREAAILPFQT